MQVSLKKKTLLILGTVLLCFILTFLIMAHLFQRHVTAEQEMALMKRNLELVLHTLEREIENLDMHAMDWAYWDDTYAFINDENDAYRQSNLVDSTFARLRLNFLVLINTDGKVVYARGMQPESGIQIPLPVDLVELVFPQGPFSPLAYAGSGRRGLLLGAQGPLLFAARPILDSEDLGPARGSLIMARRFDNGIMTELSDVTLLDVGFDTFSDTRDFEDAAPDGYLNTGEAYFYRAISAGRNEGLTLIRDLQGEPVMLLKVSTARELYNLVQSKLTIFLFFLLLAAGVFGLSMLRFLDQSVIRKLAQLSNDVARISRSGDFSRRVQVFPQADEISLLAAETNKMLSALEISRQKIQENEIEQKKTKQALQDELDKANRLHKRSISKTFPRVPGLSFAAHYHPARQLGGDFYDVIKKEDKLIFYLSDVTGHGLDGALLSVFVKSTISSYLNLSSTELITPKNIAAYLTERFILGNYPDDYFVCIFLGVLDLKTNELSYIGSGFQTPPLVSDCSGETAELISRGLPISLAVSREMLEFQEEKLTIMPGTTMLFHTDGLTEQRVGDSNYEKRLKDVFSKYSYLPAAEIIQLIKEDFRQYNRGSLQGDDDITVLVVQYEAKGREGIDLHLDGNYAEIEKVKDAMAPVMIDPLDREIFFFGLNEVITNAIEHGNYFVPGRKIRVQITYAAKYIYAVVQDDGEGFNWRNKIDLPMLLEGDTERGRGIALTRMCCDLMLYNDKGNRVLLLKNL